MINKRNSRITSWRNKEDFYRSEEINDEVLQENGGKHKPEFNTND